VEPAPDGNLTVTSVVPDSPADKAGLKKGDTVLSIGGEPVKGDARAFVENVGRRKPGESVELNWRRGEKEANARIELGKRTPDKLGELHRRLLEIQPDPKNPDKLLRLYLDRDGEGDGKPWRLQPDLEPRLRELLKGQPKQFREQLTAKERRENEDAIWNRVQKSIAGALEKTDVGPDLREKIMQAVEDARRANSADDERRARLEAEAAKLEKEMQSLKERADKLRDELNKAGQ
jgi:signal recognition particle GTPase